MATDTAIPKDVETEAEKIEIIVGNQDRHDAMSEITQNARSVRDVELEQAGHAVVDTLNVDEVSEEEKPDEEVKEEVKDDEPKEEAAKEEVKEEPPETVKIKVDGEEKEVDKDKVYDAGIRAMQKESSADKRLEDATKLLKEIQEKYAAKPKEAESPSPEEWDDATVAYALEHGTEEQKSYAVKLLRGRSDATPEEIEERAMNKALDAMDFKTASEWFLEEYGDIAKDPYLGQLAANAEANMRDKGDDRPRKELYKAIGDDLRKWRGGVTSTTLEEKSEKKSTIQNLPSASMKKEAPKQDKPRGPSDIINDMRVGRGQA